MFLTTRNVLDTPSPKRSITYLAHVHQSVSLCSESRLRLQQAGCKGNVFGDHLVLSCQSATHHQKYSSKNYAGRNCMTHPEAPMKSPDDTSSRKYLTRGARCTLSDVTPHPPVEWYGPHTINKNVQIDPK